MSIFFDYSKRLLLVNGRGYSLDKLEDFIIKYWKPLAGKYMLKPIQTGGKTIVTYDWNKIFSVALEGAIIIEEFLHQEGVLLTFRTHKPGFTQSNLFNL